MKLVRRHSSTICFAVAAVLAVLALVGWFTGVTSLTNLGLSSLSMKANTATCLLLLSLAAHVRRPVAACVAAVVTAVMAGSVVLDYAGAISSGGVNQLLVTDHVPAPNLPGRMALATALALLLVVAMLFLDRERHRLAVDLCGATVLSLCVLIVLARIYQLPRLYVRAELTSAAPHTALALACLALGVMGTLEGGWLRRLAYGPDPGAFLLRRLLVIPFVVLPLLGLAAVEAVSHGWVHPAHATAGVVVVTMALMTFASTMGARQISRLDARRIAALDHLEHTNEALELELAHRAQIIQQATEANDLLHSRGTMAAQGYDRALQRIFAVGMQLNGAARREPESSFAARSPEVLSDLEEAVTELREAIKELHRPAVPRSR